MYDAGKVLTISVALVIPALAVFYKASELRGELSKKWSEDVDIARAGLTERAISLLRDLQQATDNLLGGESGFDPDLIAADPGPLAAIAGNIQRTIAVRDKLSKRYARLTRLAFAAPVLVGAYIIGLTLCALHYLKILDFRWLPEAGFIIGIAAVAGGVAMIGTKFYLEQKLVTAQIMSRKPEPKASSSSKAAGAQLK